MTHPAGIDAPDAPTDALAAVASDVDRLLSDFLDGARERLVALDPALEPVGRELAGLVTAGGKRLRPAFVHWGHRATGADPDPRVLHPAAAVELLHTFALVHDDIMDRSPTRRGRAAVHRALAGVHREEGLDGDPEWFGVAGGILAGDLMFVWADELFEQSALPADRLARARAVFTRLRVEVMAGQYLDLRLAGLPAADEDESLHVSLLKSGRYTVTRPLQLGAAIGDADEVLDAALTAYGDAIGVAFQLRDDILGLLGDPAETGKGELSDLREGKRTLLVLKARRAAGPSAAAAIDRIVGNPDATAEDAARIREIVTATGALAEVEAELTQRRDAALRALAPVPQPARAALEELADLATDRVA